MRAIEPDQRIVRHAMSALVREAHFAGHPLAQVEQEGVGVRLQFRDPRGEFVGEVGIVVEQLGARVDDGFGAQRRNVIRVVLERRRRASPWRGRARRGAARDACSR